MSSVTSAAVYHEPCGLLLVHPAWVGRGPGSERESPMHFEGVLQRKKKGPWGWCGHLAWK